MARYGSNPSLHTFHTRTPRESPAASASTMIDLLYLLLTIVFFALMLAYVSGCERLGRQPAGDIDDGKEQRP